jgi:hypothetical protein
VSDTILVKGVKGYDAQGNVTTKNLVLYVNAVGQSSLTVTAVNGGLGTGTNKTYVPAIAEDTVIYRLSRAAAEGEMRTPSYGVLPKKSENYCQIFMAEIAQSTLQKIAEKEVDWEFSDEEEMAVKKMLREMEASFLFGVKNVTYDNVKKANVYTTEGIYNQIDKVIEYTAGVTPTDANIIDWAKTIFSGTNGSNKRLMFMGSGFNSLMSKNSSIQRQLDAGNTVVAFGLEWKEIRTDFGSILAIQYNTLDRYGCENEALVIDPNNLVKAELKSLSIVLLDLRKPGLYDGDAKVFQEISCLNIKNPKCHAIIRPAASTATTEEAGTGSNEGTGAGGTEPSTGG